MKWKNLTMPKQIVPDPANTEGYGKFVIDPLERGFGITLGNALRRVLLSSLQGAGITAVRIDGVLRMEVEISGGRGYVSADQHSQTDRPIGVIPIDSLFSPVTRVNYNVEATRLGQRIDYDKLTLEVWTDRSILPADAVAWAAKILRAHSRLFT